MRNLHLIVALSFALGVVGIMPPVPNVQHPAKKVKICDGPDAYAYHKKVCTGLANCKYNIVEVSLTQADSMGRSACAICYKK